MKKEWKKPELKTFGSVEELTAQRDLTKPDPRWWCREYSASTTGRKFVGCGDAINANVGS